MNEHNDAELVEIWPGSRALNNMVEELIKARVQKSNMHHIKTRGQNMVKQGLVKIAAALNIPVDDLYNAENASELERLITLASENFSKEDSSSMPSELQPVTKIASMGAPRLLKSTGSVAMVKENKELATMRASAAKILNITGSNKPKFEEMENCKKDIEQLEFMIKDQQD